jgi:HWE histidine kinase
MKSWLARLQALARANRALVRLNWGGVDLNALVRNELVAFSKRARISGVATGLSATSGDALCVAIAGRAGDGRDAPAHHFHVGFAPKAAELLRGSEVTRWATSRR